MPYRHLLVATTILFTAGAASAQDTQQNNSALRNILDRVMVIGTPDNIKEIGGSAHYISDEELSKYEYTDINRVLSPVPGLNIQEEEGYGNRPNIGIRGSRNDRSASITLMEDGVLISPAPYAAPSAYYFPRVDRMSAVEVRKGSSTIKFGPRTTSGAVNLISTPVPSKQAFDALAGVGSNDTRRFNLSYGNTVKNVGFVFDYGHEQTDGFKTIDIVGGDTGYDINDAMAKLKFNSDPSRDIYQEIEFKVGITREDSNETYLGLTEADFSASPYRRYAASQLDNFEGDHENYQVRHYIEPFENVDIVTTAYRNNFSRNWYKLHSIGGTSLSDILDDPNSYATEMAVIQGTSNALTADVRANKRDYYSQGIQTAIGADFVIGETENDVEFGVRYHYDEEDRLQFTDHYEVVDGVLQLQTAGVEGDAGNRVASAHAWAFHLQDKISYKQWTVTPGVRYETIELRRENYSSTDGDRSEGATSIYEEQVDALTPGVSVTYALNNDTSLFGGVHKGFAPPTAPGSASDRSDVEESINYEAGIRFGDDNSKIELLGYFNDYDNLLGNCTESSGGCDVGSSFNGGEVDVYGIELSASYDVAALVPDTRYRLPVSLSYTYTKAEFQSSFAADDFEEWGSVSAGDTVPYVAENQLYITAGIEDDKWSFNVAGRYVDEMRTKTETQAAADGGTQGTDSHFIVDAAAEYEVAEGTRAFVTVDNLFDEEYIASRRPAGFRPGKPLTFIAGVKVKF